jgi:hypothetical protein
MSVFTLLLLTGTAHLHAADAAPKPAITVYKHNYNGLTTGVTTKEQMIEILGEPQSSKNSSGGLHALYPKITVTFDAERAGINTIIIQKDAEYRCPNGFKLGDDASALKQLPEATTRFSPGVTVDRKNGICYWTGIGEGNKVATIQKIVLAGALVGRK